MELNYWDAITNMELAKKIAEPAPTVPHVWLEIERTLNDFVAEVQNRVFSLPEDQVPAAITEARLIGRVAFHLKARLQEKLHIILPAETKAGE